MAGMVGALAAEARRAAERQEQDRAEMRRLAEGQQHLLEYLHAAAQEQRNAPRGEEPAGPNLHANYLRKIATYPKTDGSQDLHRWAQLTEAAFQLNRVEDDASKILLAMSESLEGAAQTWLMQKQRGEQRVETWQQLKDQLKAAFGRKDDQLHLYNKLCDLRATGSIDAYTREFMALTIQLDSISDAIKMRHYMDGLPERLRTKVRESAPVDFDAVLTKTRALADVSEPQTTHTVAAPAYAQERPSMDVDAWSGDRRRGGSSWRPAHGDGATRRPAAGSRRCWRCQKEGHTAPNCRAPEPVPRPHDA